MESISVNWLAVILATLSTMVTGSLWYARPVFGNAWQKLAKIDEKKMTQGFIPALIKTLIASFLMAFVLAHMAGLAGAFYDVDPLAASLTTAFWLWLGISAATVVVHDSFEHRPAKLTLITISYQLVSMTVMGLIIGWFGGF